LPVSSVEEAQPFVSGRCRWGLLVERVIDGSGQIQREAVAVRGVGNLVADVIPGPLLDVRAAATGSGEPNCAAASTGWVSRLRRR
jgi:hypothetical protein